MLPRPARQNHPHLPMGLAQQLPVRQGMETRSTSSTRLSIQEVQASSNPQTLAIPRRRSVNTHTLRETVDQTKRKQLTCLRPGTQPIMSRARPGTPTLLTLRTTSWCDGAALRPCANSRITKPCIVMSITYQKCRHP